MFNNLRKIRIPLNRLKNHLQLYEVFKEGDFISVDISGLRYLKNLLCGIF
jgi:hypothetical protein